MSVRPRPVTATFLPTNCSDYLTSTPKCHNRYSLSSGTSTESLISILDHDSYESPVDSDLEEKQIEEKNVKSDVKISRPSKPKPMDDITSVSTNPTTQTEESEKEQPMSPWELWLIRKTKEVRLKQKEEIEKKKKLKEEEKRKVEEKKMKGKETELKVNNWIERQNTMYKVKLKEQKLKEQTEKELKEQQKLKIEEKAKTKYHEWMNKKNDEEKERLKLEKAKKKEEEVKKMEKEKKNEEAFNEWCKKSRQRRKSAPQSFGYTQGKLTGYHDTAAYPTPSFYNPIPWQPIHVPNPRSVPPKRKKTKKYTWNPNKYL